MAPFDPRAYEDQVLKPMRRLLPDLPTDLQARYAVDASMDDGALRQRVGDVVRLWNKLGLRQGRDGMVARQLIHEHTELEKAGDDLGSRTFWQAWGMRHRQSVDTGTDALAAELRADFGALTVITEPQLRAAANLHSELGPEAVAQARAKAGLQLVEPVDLPTSPGIRTQLRVLNDAVLAAGAVSIPELLFPGLTSFGLLDGLSVTPRPKGRTVALTHQAATERMLELDKVPDTQRVRAVRAAVGILVTEGKAGVDLTALTLFHLLQPVRAQQAAAAQAGTLFSHLVKAKVTPRDAGRMTVSLLSQGVHRDPAAEVNDLLAGGRLVAAQQAATSLAGDEGEAARAACVRRRDEVAALRAAAATDQSAGRDQEAAAKLREALGLAVDLPGLAEELAAVPAAAVLAASAVADGAGVRITWRPAPSHNSSTSVRVLRGNGRPPGDPDDGVVLAPQGGHADDLEPPVGTQVHYAVFARVGQGRWSRSTVTTVRVVPPVSDVVVEGGTGVVSGRWRVHPGVATVDVRRSSGTPDAPGEPVRVDRGRAFRDESVTDGVQYYYSLVAVYPSPSGGPPLRSAAVVTRGASRLEATPVRSLTTAVMPGGATTVRFTWRQKPGAEVVLRRASKPCPWPYADTVTRGDLAGWGHEVDGDLTERKGAMTLVASIPPGRSWIAPFTMSPEGGLRGDEAYLEVIDPVRQAQAQRFGDDIRITWTWPENVSAAEVLWPGGRRRITQQQYREEGGCHLGPVAGVARIDIVALVLGGDEEGRSAAVSVHAGARPVQVSYQLARRGSRLIGGVRCTVTMTSPDPLPHATVVLVGSSGPVMPLSPGDGMEIQREQVALQAGVALPLDEVVVPSSLRKPYWLRCFVLEPASALLVDPPVSQLKVS